MVSSIGHGFVIHNLNIITFENTTSHEESICRTKC